MSRHRNVRSMNYSEEYEGFDDVYGHSVEDEYCISPSDEAQFMYDRTRQPQMSAFFNEEDNIAEEDETGEGNPSQGKVRPPLGDIEEARLLSCLEEIRNVIGDSVAENILVKIVLKNDFDINKSLDVVLSNLNSTAEKDVNDAPKPQRVRRERDRDDDFISSQCSLFDIANENDVSSLREEIEMLGIQDLYEKPLSCSATTTTTGRPTQEPNFCALYCSAKGSTKLCDVVDSCTFDMTIDRQPSSQDKLDIDSPSVTSTSLRNKVIPDHTLHTVQSNSKIHVQCSTPSEIITDNAEVSLSSFIQNKVTRVQAENVFQHLGSKPFNFNIPRFQTKARKDSDKENMENVSTDEHESDIHFSPLTSLASQQNTLRKQTESHDDNLILSPQKEKLSTLSSAFGVNVNPGKRQVNALGVSYLHQQNSDEELEFSPLALLANKYSGLSNRQPKNSSVHTNLVEGLQFSPVTAMASHSRTSNNHPVTSNLKNVHDKLEFSLLSTLSSKHSHTTEKQPELSSNLQNVGESNFSPLMALANKHSEAISTQPTHYNSDDEIEFSPLSSLASKHSNVVSKQPECFSPEESDEEIEFSPLATLASKYSKPSNTLSGNNSSSFPSLEVQDEYRSNNKEQLSFSMLSQHESQPIMISNKHVSESRKAFLSDDDDDDVVEGNITFSSLADFAGRYQKVNESSNSLPSSLCGETLGSYNFPKVETMGSSVPNSPIGNVGSLKKQEELEIDHLKVQYNEPCEDGQLSSLSSLVARFTVEEDCDHKCSPLGDHDSSLSDIVAHHLIRSSSCRKMEEDLESFPKKSLSEMNTCISEGLPRRFVIPSLGYLPNAEGSSSSNELRQDAKFSDDIESINNKLIIDLSTAIKSPSKRVICDVPKVISIPEIICYEMIESMEVSKEVKSMHCLVNASTILNEKYPYLKRKSSSFGKILCRRWRSLPLPYLPPRKKSTTNTVPFTFNTPSPDDRTLVHLRRRK